MPEFHVEEHSSLIKTPKQLVTSGADLPANHPGMSEEAVAKRLKPVGEVVIDPSQPAPAAAEVNAAVDYMVSLVK